MELGPVYPKVSCVADYDLLQRFPLLQVIFMRPLRDAFTLASSWTDMEDVCS
jgi:hypothetical protein